MSLCYVLDVAFFGQDFMHVERVKDLLFLFFNVDSVSRLVERNTFWFNDYGQFKCNWIRVLAFRSTVCSRCSIELGCTEILEHMHCNAIALSTAKSGR
jgi:hypothetical protein